MEPVNLGSPREFTIKQLANLILRMTDSHSELSFRDLPSDDPKVRKPDISKAKKLLDWFPQVDLEEGLKRTIPYFRNFIE